MVPVRCAATQTLLPFEKHLIDVLGCSEDEYQAFVAEVRRKGTERGPEYQHIPDIRNDPVTATVVSIVVGLAATAASVALAPKPKLPSLKPRSAKADSSTTKFRTRQLVSQTASDIFTPSYGFDAAQELAAYGNTVPIAFTKRTADGTGGLLISPALVWSRIKSWGSYQVMEIVCIAGQGDMAKPDLAGIFLGNNVLDGIYDEYFDFYWNGGFEVRSPGSRLQMFNLRYGNFSIDNGRGDYEDAFYAPTREGANQAAFSGAFTPTSQTRFGVYSAIPNGTPYRPNWEVVSALKDYEADAKIQAHNKQRKFVDPWLMAEHPYGGVNGANGDIRPRDGGMPGTGTNYARRVGIIDHRSAATGALTTHQLTNEYREYWGTRWTNITREVEVNPGDIITILLGRGRQQQRPFPSPSPNVSAVSLDDVRSAVEAEANKYDQMLSMGATFMIGRSTWQVIERPSVRYDAQVHSGSGYLIRLKCLEVWSQRQRKIGILDQRAVTVEDWVYNGNIDETFYSILKYQMGTFQNTRACDVTEIGIKSQVWTRFNGITNFNSLLVPFYMRQSNLNGITLQAGTLTGYAHRMSFFALDVRPANAEAYRTERSNEGWVNLGPYLFAVIGDSPIDIYSFIRVQQPIRGQFEYRLRPFPAAVQAQQAGGNADVFALDGSKTPTPDNDRQGNKSWTWDTYMGRFTISGRGEFAKPKDYFTHRSMAGVPEDPVTGQDNIESVTFGEWVPDPDNATVSLLHVRANENGPGYSAGQDINENTLSNVMAIFFDEDPYFDGLGSGVVRTKSGWVYSRDGKSVSMTLRVRSFRRDYSHTPRNYWWRIESTTVDSVTGEWSSNDTFVKNARNVNGVQFGFTYQVEIPNRYVEFDTPRTRTRLFQQYSGIAETSHYGDLITRSCDSGPEHEVVYVNECLAENVIPQYDNCAVVGLKLKSSENFQQVDQLRCYMQNGLEVERLVEGGTGPSNLLTDLLWYLFTNTDTGSGSIVNSDLIDRDALTTTGRYLQANKLYFDGVVAEPINIRSWLAGVAPSMLSYIALKNGKFSLEPALPYNNSSYEIDYTRPVQISAMFTDGNILEDTFNVEWLELEERKLFQAAIIYRTSEVNEFPQEETLVVRYNESNAASLPLEEFNLEYVTGMQHALKAARYFLALRKHQTHSISFRTLPWGLSLSPGDFIRVSTEASPYSPANNGIVKADGQIVSVSELSDGSYNVYAWERQTGDVRQSTLRVSNGVATNLRDSVFSIINNNASSQVYQVESIDIDEEGIVSISASNYAVDSSNRSMIARDVVDADNAFTVIGGPVE